jgi:hypothetical protein
MSWQVGYQLKRTVRIIISSLPKVKVMKEGEWAVSLPMKQKNKDYDQVRIWR